MTAKSNHLQSIMQPYNLDNLVKEPTCFHSRKPSQINLLLINTFETGLSGHHKLISAIANSSSF